MAEDDIYGNKRKYEAFINNLNVLLIPPEKRAKRKSNSIYYCRNKHNLEYFKKLFLNFDSKDTSYVRRNRLLNTFKLIVHSTDKDLKTMGREDIDQVITQMHRSYNSMKSKSDFIRDIKHIWRVLFPELDERGRIDDALTPYPVRHLSAKIDKSREKRKGDRISYEEFERIISYFGKDPRIQLFLMLSFESLGRPQEILYTRLKDVEVSEDYAKIWISERGKEGTGLLQVIDSFPYLMKWLAVHPTSKNKDSFLFINLEKRSFGTQLTPFNIRKKLRKACLDLGINKPITPYSFKRNGITFRRLRGDSDVEIQHTARWTSTKQLKTYDKSDQEDAFKIALIKKGLVKSEDAKFKHYEPKYRVCPYCNNKEGFESEICQVCKRPLDRLKIEEAFKRKELDYDSLKLEVESLKAKLQEREFSEEKIASFLEKRGIKHLFKLLHKIELLEKQKAVVSK